MADLNLRTDLIAGRRRKKEQHKEPRRLVDYPASTWRISPAVKTRLINTLATRDLSLNDFLVLSVDRWLCEQGEPGIEEIDPHFVKIWRGSTAEEGRTAEPAVDPKPPRDQSAGDKSSRSRQG
ncbi:hypothetical protein [Aurantimonas sp. HBX-1]|uniref:hypothetical protein n=1 Tax=Aurantimonas sp. HBX-1 TaxID=2906072 RepID=UPI001F41827A|nr:hypothetical protein [Aurantimonas sp. HBX-1]UIJ70434.1 hypothetical protein LXB15_11705 [Aurantimonas sp. HBX-1]